MLVSSTVKDLVAGSGLVFEDRGELKGVPDPWPTLPSAGRERRGDAIRAPQPVGEYRRRLSVWTPFVDGLGSPYPD
jgi:hypothetical protein